MKPSTIEKQVDAIMEVYREFKFSTPWDKRTRENWAVYLGERLPWAVSDRVAVALRDYCQTEGRI